MTHILSCDHSFYATVLLTRSNHHHINIRVAWNLALQQCISVVIWDISFSYRHIRTVNISSTIQAVRASSSHQRGMGGILINKSHPLTCSSSCCLAAVLSLTWKSYHLSTAEQIAYQSGISKKHIGLDNTDLPPSCLVLDGRTCGRHLAKTV